MSPNARLKNRKRLTGLPSVSRPGRLGRRLKRWLHERIPRAARHAHDAHERSGVLIVDDDRDFREELALLLGSEGIEVAEAANGREALHLLPHHAPRLIVLDLDMPVMTGLEFLETKRVLWRRDLRAIPVLVMTCVDAWAQRAAELGAVAVLRKPFRFDALLTQVDVELTRA